MADYGLLTSIEARPRSVALVAAAAVSDTELEVTSAGDYDPENGGTLELNGIQLEYTGVVWGATEDDSDFIELASPLAAPADEGDLVTPVVGGLAAEDWYAVVDMGGGGAAVEIPVLFEQRQMWAPGQYDPPVPVAVAENLSRIEDAPGRPAVAGSRVEACNEDEWDAAGNDTDSPGVLTYLPRPQSLMVFQNGVRLRNSGFTLVDRVATPLASANVIRDGDKFSAYYLRDPAAEVVGGGDNPDEVSSEYDAAVLAEPTLLGYWRLAETDGLIMVDSSGNDRHGTYSSDVVLGATGLLVGDPDTSAHFPDTLAPRGVVPHDAWMDVATFSIECWAATDASSSGILALPNRDTDFRSWQFLQTSGGGLSFSKVEGGTVTSTVGASGLDDTNPHHVVSTYDGANIRLYIDGALVQTTACTGNMSTDALLAVGGTYVGGGTWWAPFYYKGRLGKVAFYSGAQSGAAILNRYQIGAGL